VDAVTFTSGSTVENLLAALADEEGPRLLSKTCVAVIGPVTASVARARGIDVSVEAPRASVEALADALVAHFHDVHG
jgi:uroporphyrinogen III methyltransferase/synthase